MRKKRVGLIVLTGVSLTLLGCYSLRYALLPAVGGRVEGARAEAVAAQPNHRDGRLQNDLALDESLGAVAGAIFGAKAEATRPDELLQFPGDVPPRETAALAATWLGHSTLFLELDGARVLLDPMWSDTASPVAVICPRRYLVPLVALDAI